MHPGAHQMSQEDSGSELETSLHAPGEPITAARIECCLDRLSEIIADDTNGGRVYLPIYARLEREFANLQAAEDLLAAAHERVRRLRGRTAAQS